MKEIYRNTGARNDVHKPSFCSRLLKFRHSFLNGYGRLRTAFLIDRKEIVTDGTKRYDCPEKWKPANIIR